LGREDGEILTGRHEEGSGNFWIGPIGLGKTDFRQEEHEGLEGKAGEAWRIF
jgi:hypothetical protein